MRCLGVIPGGVLSLCHHRRAEGEGRRSGFQWTLEWIPFPALRAAGDDTVEPRSVQR
jgi:hypothetical protein